MAQLVSNLSATQETWVWSLSQEDPLEKGMATRSSLLPWRIPWIEEPCRLQSKGKQRVGHNWMTSTHLCLLILFCLSTFTHSGVSVFMEATSIWFNWWSKEGPPSLTWVGITQSSEGQNRTQRVRWNECCSLLPEMSIFSCPHADIRAPGSWPFRFRDMYQQLPWCLGLWAHTELHHWLSLASNLQTTEFGT